MNDWREGAHLIEVLVKEHVAIGSDQHRQRFQPHGVPERPDDSLVICRRLHHARHHSGWLTIEMNHNTGAYSDREC